MSATTLILLRHGATLANVRQPYVLQGLRPDSALIDQGIAQAAAAAQAVRSYPIVRAYSSPLQRAHHTARIIAGSLAVPLDLVPELVEADVGEWTGLSWAEIEQRWPDAHRAFHEDPARHGYLGGENLTEVRNRVLPAIEKLVARHGGETFLVVGHGLVNRVLLAYWLGLPLCHARRLPQDNAGLNLIEFQGTDAKVRTVNAAAHLAAGSPDVIPLTATGENPWRSVSSSPVASATSAASSASTC